MSSSDNAPGKRRSRKSIAVMPTNAAATTSSNSSAPGEGSKEREREREKETETLALKPKKKSRSKSLGPGGLLDASGGGGGGGAEAGGGGNGLKSGSGNGRRESLAPAATVKSILKPTLPISPLKPIPAHRTRSTRAPLPPFTMAPTHPSSSAPSSKPPKVPSTTTTTTTTATPSSSSSSSSSSGALNFNPPPPPTTVPIRTEEEQQRRAEILAARAARRQSMGNRRVSFAPEATLHTWDVIEYYPAGATGTPSSSGSGSSTASTPANNRGAAAGNLSTIEATPTETSLAADDTPVRLPEALGGGDGNQGPATPMGAAQQKRSFESPVFSSSPFSSSPGSAFGGLAQEGEEADDDGEDSESGSGSEDDDDDDDDEEPGAEDRTFVTMGGDETMGEMTMDIADDDDEVTGVGAGFGAFGTRKAWKLEGSTETVEDPVESDNDGAATAITAAKPPTEDGEEEEEEGGEMTMDMTRAVGGLLPAVVEYPALPVSREDEQDQDDGGEMTMDMTCAIGGVLPPPTFSNPYVDKEKEENEKDMTMDMDMTRPVGGILSSAANALQRATRKSLGFFTSAPSVPAAAPAPPPVDKDGMTMDMTVALGGILSKAPPETETETELPSSPMCADATMDMDMTRPVGGIISAASAPPKPAARFASSSSPAGSDDEGNEEMTMEFTSVLGGIIGDGSRGGGGGGGGRRSSLARGGGAGKLMSGAEWARQQEAQKGGNKAQKKGGNKEDEDGEDGKGGGDMDFTVASSDTGVDKDSDSDDDMEMDITTAIGSILPSKADNKQDDEWTPASIPARTAEEQEEEEQQQEKQQEEEEELEEAKEATSSPTPAKRGGRSSRRSSSAASTPTATTTTASPRVTRSARKKTPDAPPPPPHAEEQKAAENTPGDEAKAETPVGQRRQTPTRKAATPKAKSATPKNQGKKKPTAATAAPAAPAAPAEPAEPAEPAKPDFVFATPQKKTPAPFSQPQTPPGQATPAIPPRPKTPSKHTPMIQTPLRQVTTPGLFSLSTKHNKPSTFPTSPSPANRITAPRTGDAPDSPSTTRGVGINKLGLGSPRVAAKLSARKSLTETTLPFSPTAAAPKDLLKASQADAAAERKEAQREREMEVERRKGLDLKSRIDLLTPRRAARKSLAYGALLQGGKRERGEEDAGGYLGGGKRRKSFEAGAATTPRRNFDFDKAPSLPTPGQGRTPRRKAVTIAEEPVVAVAMSSSPMAPPPPKMKPVEDEKMQESSDEEEIGSEEEEQERITLQEFLSMTSISFLDGLTTTKRRQTGFPGLDLRRGRRSDVGSSDVDPNAAAAEASMADCVMAGACTVPMLELFQHSCRELKQYIKEGRAIVKEIEHDTSDDNPPLFREYLDAPPDIKVIMDTQFKNVKTHARLLARGIWYKWRRQLMDGVKTALESNLDDMHGDEAALEAARVAAEGVLPAWRARREGAARTAARLEEARRRCEGDDKEQLARAREGLTEVARRIEEVKAKLAQRSKELEDVNERIGARGARKAELQAAIDEAERVKEQNRGWSEEEVAGWAARAEEIERRCGWGVVGVRGGSVVEFMFLRQLRVLWDATGAAPTTTVEYVVEAVRKPSDPLPLEEAERDFFVGALNRRLVAGGRTLKGAVAEVDAFWRRCLGVAEEIERVRGWYPVLVREEAGEGGGRMLVAIKVLVAEVRSKVVIELAVDADLGVQSAARVVYGGVNAEAVGEFVGKTLGVEGAWRSVVDGVVGRCVEGRRRGGVGVPTKT